MHASRRQGFVVQRLRSSRDLPAKQNFADQHIPQPVGGLPQCWNGYGEPDECICGSEDTGKRCQQQ